MWFEQLEETEKPGKQELQQFVEGVKSFLEYVIDDTRNFGFLWESNPELRRLATETLNFDIKQGAGSLLQDSISKVSEKRLETHGLVGRPLRFKLLVLISIERKWRPLESNEQFPRTRVRRHRSRPAVRRWFKRMVDAIDAILDSLCDATGSGGIIKEFKDALSALAG